jgi:hypothetical protein
MSDDVTWQRNAASQIVLDSIFAALAGVWVTIALPASIPNMSVWFKIIEGSFSLVSFFLFAISAEGSLTASDENDVIKYLYYLLWYNVGVILIGVALTLFAFERLQHFIAAGLTDCPGIRHFLGTFDLVVYLIVALLLLWRWIHDAWFLRFGNDDEFQHYVEELTDRRAPTPDRHYFMRYIFARRLRRNEETAA